MPTYEYRCPEGHDFEHFVLKISAAAAVLPCPTCGAEAPRRVSAGGGLLFKGSGFYHGLRQGRKEGSARRRREDGRRCRWEIRARAVRLVSVPSDRQPIFRERLLEQLLERDVWRVRVVNAVDRLRAALGQAALSVGAPSDTTPALERPRDPSHGDWATNLAMTLAKPLGQKPREVADALVAALDLAAAGVAEASVAGPGFINFRLDTGDLAAGLARILEAGDGWGRADAPVGRTVVVEFVSANPTGPLHVGHGRQAALGDAISALLTAQGWEVTREFYYNDAGVQIANLARSVQARLRERAGLPLEIPEGGYHGAYIREIAERYAAEHPTDARGDDLEQVRTVAVRELRHEQDLDLRAFGVRFDVYYLESSLYTDGRVERTVANLIAAGHTFEDDGALYLRTTAFGDDKDRVMRKRDGTFTYFVPDVAYHVTKFERGFTRAINVQGADHHGTTARVRAGLQALGVGIPVGYPEYVLHQMVTVMRGGEEVKISKRAGSYVTVRDLIDEVGRDAVRYFFLMRKGDSQLVFDVDLARS